MTEIIRTYTEIRDGKEYTVNVLAPTVTEEILLSPPYRDRPLSNFNPRRMPFLLEGENA